MTDVIGIELNAEHARAAAFGALRPRPQAWHELPFDPARPADLVAQLRARFGVTRRLAISVGLAFLHVKHVKLPPAPAAERRRMIALEPDRFFPVQDAALAVALASDAELAFAIDADLLERWLTAFGEYAPVDAVEPAPLSLARALGASAEGSYALPAGSDERGVIELGAGGLHSARRVPAAARDVPPAQPAPARAGVPGEYLVACGVTGAITASLESMLLPEARAAALRGRRARRTTLTAVLCAAAFLLAFWSLDRARDRTLERLSEEVARATPRAAVAAELDQRLALAAQEARATAELASRRPDPLPVLAALGALPADATVLNLRALGADWQIDGRAADAAAIVALLAANTQLEDVRFLSASSRFRENDRTYETFSIAFRVRPST